MDTQLRLPESPGQNSEPSIAWTLAIIVASVALIVNGCESESRTQRAMQQNYCAIQYVVGFLLFGWRVGAALNSDFRK
jgi:hypothetical protein